MIQPGSDRPQGPFPGGPALRGVGRAVLLALLALLPAPVGAHFTEGTQLRLMVKVESAEATRIHVRAPVPLVFADMIVAATRDRRLLDSPHLRFERAGATSRYRLSADAVSDPGFRARVAGALRFTRDGAAVPADLVALRLSPRVPRAAFDSAAAAAEAVSRPSTGLDPVFGEAILEYTLRLPPGPGLLAVESALPAIPLAPGIEIDNHLISDTGRGVVTAPHAGQLQQAAPFPATALATIGIHAARGVDHILGGLDHVLLVVCFALGAGGGARLVWLVSAFTLGHSATLALGAAQIVPQAPWLVAGVELAVALSVAAAALGAWHGRMGPAWFAAPVGLVHGTGFASVLAGAIPPRADSFLPALFGFNVGIEIGQLILIGLTLLLFDQIRRAGPRAATLARGTTLAGIGALALVWTAERLIALA